MQIQLNEINLIMRNFFNEIFKGIVMTEGQIYNLHNYFNRIKICANDNENLEMWIAEKTENHVMVFYNMDKEHSSRVIMSLTLIENKFVCVCMF